MAKELKVGDKVIWIGENDIDILKRDKYYVVSEVFPELRACHNTGELCYTFYIESTSYHLWYFNHDFTKMTPFEQAMEEFT